jgi:hypothetical protein
MPQTTNTLEHERDSHPAQPCQPTPLQVREALARLREVGEALPPVDAVAIVRESRD